MEVGRQSHALTTLPHGIGHLLSLGKETGCAAKLVCSLKSNFDCTVAQPVAYSG